MPKQNLILFFEEKNDISSKLVRLYMNRCVIAEDDQSEISGIYLLSKRDRNAEMIEFYCENGQFHWLNPTDKDLGIMQKSFDKFKNDRSLFELSASKIIGSETARQREQDWFRECLKGVQEHDELENQSDKNSGLSYPESFKLQSTQWENQYINHLVIGTSFYINRSIPLQRLCKQILRNCFLEAAFTVNHKKGSERNDICFALKSIESSTIVTVLRGYSAIFLTKEQVRTIYATLKTDELEDFYNLIMTTTEPFSNDEFQTFDSCKLLTVSELRDYENNRNQINSRIRSATATDVEYKYAKCERHSFSIAKIPSPTNSLDDKEYFLSYDEHNGEINSSMIRACVNKFVIDEVDQIEVTGYNYGPPTQITFCLKDYSLFSKLKEFLVRKIVQNRILEWIRKKHQNLQKFHEFRHIMSKEQMSEQISVEEIESMEEIRRMPEFESYPWWIFRSLAMNIQISEVDCVEIGSKDKQFEAFQDLKVLH